MIIHSYSLAMFSFLTFVYQVPVVGGMSEQKQMRLLNRRPPIVVATPGRMWEFVTKRHGTTVGEGEGSL